MRLRYPSPPPRRTGPRETAHAMLRGAVASMAMSGMRTVTTSLGLVEQSPPVQVAGGEASGGRRAAIELGHWAFGAAGALGYAALPATVRRRPYTGPLYGLAVWTGFELTAPLLGLPHARGPRPAERLAIAADHVLYGFVLDEMRRAPRA